MNCDALPNEHMRKICKGEIPFGNPEQHDALMVRWFRDLAKENGVIASPNVRARASKAGVGVGSVMARKIKWLTGITAENATCNCAVLRDQMDMMGTDWCANNADMIVAKVIANAKSRESTSIIETVAGMAISTSIGRGVAENAVRKLLHSAIQEVDSRADGSRIPRSGPPPQPRPFTSDPSLTLLFHVYPTSADVLEKHRQWLEPVLPRFQRRILGVAVGEDTMTAEQAANAIGGEWEVVPVSNNPRLREVKTYKRMMQMLDYSDPNAVTFCAHGKGAQKHTSHSEPVNWWTEAMYRTVLHNIDEVLQQMEQGYYITGSFRRLGRHLGVRHRYHYSGTFYAFRNVLVNGLQDRIRSVWWGTESWPGDCISFSHSACLFGDDCGNLYYEDSQPRNELREWLRARRGVNIDGDSFDAGR